MTNIPRDAGFYYPTTHTVDRAKTRDIDMELIATTIEDGYVQPAKGNKNLHRFIKEYAWLEHPIGVVANIKTGEIVTVFKNTEYELPEGYE